MKTLEQLKKEAHRKECSRECSPKREYCRDTEVKEPVTDKYEYDKDGLPSE